MVKKVVDKILPTTMVGSYPRPHKLAALAEGAELVRGELVGR